MHVERYGDGPRVALALHGWGGDHREFAPLAARRPRDATLWTVDLPGYGRSPPPASWTPGGIVAPLREVLERLAPGPLTVVAFCSGTVPAMKLALDAPERVARIVLVDPFDRVPWYFRHFTWGRAGERAYRAAFVHPRGRALINAILRRRQATSADFTAAFQRLDPELVLRYLRIFAAFDRREAFAGLTLPIDIVYGSRTFRAVRQAVHGATRGWPQARLHRLDGVGHLPLVQGARAIASIVWPPAGEGASMLCVPERNGEHGRGVR